jgi:plastocyanin
MTLHPSSRPYGYAMRRVLASLPSAVVVLGLLVGIAPSAQAADLGTVTVSYDASAPSFVSFSPTSLTGGTGDTFTFVNNRYSSGSSYISIENGTGSATMGGTPCTSSTACQLLDRNPPPRSDVVTVTNPGTFTIYRFNAGTLQNIGTLTISGGAGTVNADPALVYPTATIDANGGTCTGSMQFIKAPAQNASGGTFTAPSASSCTRTNYALRGWAQSATATTSAFAPGSTVPIGAESFTLFAVWEPLGVEIRYNANVGSADQCISGGSNIAGDARQSAATVLAAGAAVATQAPCTPVDAQLVGWALTGNGPSVVAAGAALPSSFTQGSSHVLYAKWQVVYGLTSSSQAVSVRPGEAVSVTFTATVNGAPAAGRDVAVSGSGVLLALSADGGQDGTTPIVRPVAAVTQSSIVWPTNGFGRMSVTLVASGSDPGTVTASFGNVRAVVQVTIAQPQSIVITGERATVSGKSGIRVEGQATGFGPGAKVIPWIRFPGETSFTAGSARPGINADGSFTWERKTGKRISVYVTSEDGSVRSNTVTIAAP